MGMVEGQAGGRHHRLVRGDEPCRRKRQASEQGAREDVRETRTETTVLSIKTSDNKKWKMNDVEDIEERK